MVLYRALESIILDRHRHVSPECLRKLLRISSYERRTNDWVRSKISLLVGPQEPPRAKYRETETRLVRARHVPRQPLQNHPSERVGWRATPWSAEKLLDRDSGCPRQRVTFLPLPELLLLTAVHRKDRKRISAESSLMHQTTTQSAKGLN